MKIHVNTHACSGQARCAAVAPDVFRLNDEGYNDSDDFELTDGQVTDACRGALACPEQAITLIDVNGVALSEDELRRTAGVSAR
jgi:ferredoxin